MMTSYEYTWLSDLSLKLAKVCSLHKYRLLDLPHIGINKFSPMNDFRSENSVTGVTDVGVTGETEDLVTVTTSIPQQDVVLTLPDSSDKIKPQNIEKAVFIFD